MSATIEHYEDKATKAVLHANNANTEAGVAFWIGSGQIAATLALMGAVQELNETLRERLP